MSLQMIEGHTELSFQYARVNGQEETLLEFLLRRFRYYGPKEWGDHIKSGHLLVDGQQGKAGQKLRNKPFILLRTIITCLFTCLLVVSPFSALPFTLYHFVF